MLCHVGEKGDVAVGESGDYVTRLEPLESRRRVGPCVEPVPRLVEVDLFVLSEAGDLEPIEKLVEDHAVEVVDAGPGELAASDAGHRRSVARSPGVGELGPVDVGQTLAVSEHLALSGDAAAPVDNRSEDIEYEGLDFVDQHFRPSSWWYYGCTRTG